MDRRGWVSKLEVNHITRKRTPPQVHMYDDKRSAKGENWRTEPRGLVGRMSAFAQRERGRKRTPVCMTEDPSQKLPLRENWRRGQRVYRPRSETQTHPVRGPDRRIRVEN
jgi:hypothetical protein